MKIQKIIAIIALTMISFSARHATAQLHPAEGSMLHYRLIGFTFPSPKPASNYKLEIATGNFNNEADFKKHIIKSIPAKTNKIIAEVPTFGTEYTWRITGNNNSTLHHFSTLKSDNIDTDKHRLTIVKNSEKYAGAYIFTDGNKALYNMKGEAVWFLPNIKGVVDDYSVVRDIKLTPQNTITFLTYNMVYEINYDAQIIWSGPNNGIVSGDSQEHYHHELTRLSNGHYMALGFETLRWEWKRSPAGDSEIVIVPKAAASKPTTGLRKQTQMGTIIEYDNAGKVVWSWKSSTYYKDDKIKLLESPIGMKDSHENAFYFDEKRKLIYVSFKNTNQVLKVKYPEGAVLNVYDGSQIEKGPTGSDLYLFSEQHACKSTADGNLYLYNNNIANSYAPPKVLILRQPENGSNELTKIWEYVHPSFGSTLRQPLTSGGNVQELPDQSMFVSSCSPYSNIFIVNKNKELLWDAALEKWSVNDKSWLPFSLYRASIITTRKKMEQLIWGQ